MLIITLPIVYNLFIFLVIYYVSISSVESSFTCVLSVTIIKCKFFFWSVNTFYFFLGYVRLVRNYQLFHQNYLFIKTVIQAA